MLKLGLLGGSFDPIHCDHLALAKGARRDLGLAKVLLIPNAAPPHKSGCRADYCVRRALLQLAVASEPGLELAEWETTAGRHYTYATLTRLRAFYGPKTALYFLIGRDGLCQLHTWQRGFALTRLAHIVVCGRCGWQEQDLPATTQVWLREHLSTPTDPRPAGGVILLPWSLHAISSHAVRAALACRDPQAAAWLPPAVYAYLCRRRLYT